MQNVTKSLVATVILLAAGTVAVQMFGAGSVKTDVLPVPEEQAEELRSSMTLREVEAATGVPREYLITYLNLPGCIALDNNKPAQEWLSRHGLTMTDLREAVARYRSGHRFQSRARSPRTLCVPNWDSCADVAGQLLRLSVQLTENTEIRLEGAMAVRVPS